LQESGSTDDERSPALEALTGERCRLQQPFLAYRNAKTMSLADVTYLPETPAHDPEIESINEEAFGPGRFARAAYKIREGGPHERDLSFVAMNGGTVIASVRMTRVMAGSGKALLLGPLAVRPAFKNLGIGRKLVAMALGAAAKAGSACVILVGDEPYYGPLGFKRIPRGQITMPRPVDLDRLLTHEIEPGATARLTGMVHHADQVGVGEPA
jgi:predicted N-acetyltransferase YhbS